MCGKRPSRILFICGGSYVAGLEIVTHQLAIALRNRGIHCQFVISAWNNGEFAKLLADSGFPFDVLHIGGLYRTKPRWTLMTLSHAPRTIGALRRAVKEFDADIIVAPGNIEMLYAILGNSTDAAVIVHAHERPNPLYSRFPLRRAILSTAGVVAVSRFIGDQLKEALPDRVMVRVALNGTAVVPPRPEPANERLVFAVVGQIIPSKGHATLVDALAKIAPDVRQKMIIHVVGSGPEKEQEILRVRVATHNLGDTFRFLGPTRDQNAIYADADVLISCAEREPFGLTVIEAAMRGIPSIAPSRGGFVETIEDGVTGLLYDPDDADSLPRAIERACDAALRQRLGTSARARALEIFSIEHTTERFLAEVEALRYLSDRKNNKS